MWVRSAAIRPVPAFARLQLEDLTDVEDGLSSDEEAEQTLSLAFEQFELRQPALAECIGNGLAGVGDEVALALGYFLCLTLWMAFDRKFSSRVDTISSLAMGGVEESMDLDEQLRGTDPAEAIDSDDVVAMEQPDVVRFINEHVEAALEAHASDIDVEAVHRVYRLLLIEALALSYAVSPPADYRGVTTEASA